MPEQHVRTSRTVDRVRWADVDLVGIMRYSAFTRLVELGEQELMREAGMPFSEVFQSPEVWLPRRQLTVEYFAPARIDDALAIESFVSRMGETSMTYHFDMRNESGVLVASASLVVVCVTVESFTKRPLPQEFRDNLAPFVMSVDDARAAHQSRPR